MRQLLLPVILAMLAIPDNAVAAWPTTKFEVFIGKPNFGLLPDEEQIPFRRMSDQTKAEIEAYLEEIASEYEKQGFPAPYIVPLRENDNGEPVYRVYYFDGEGGPTAARASDKCGRGHPYILLNGLSFLKPVPGSPGNFDLTPKAYQDIAHELFHGIQATYPLFKANCDKGLGKWIGEGTAQAVGADMAAWWSSRQINQSYIDFDWVYHRWGLRHYSSSLAKRKNEGEANLHYGASSFWRYLAEDLATSGAAGTKAIEPNYTYLQKLFLSSLPGAPSVRNEISWIHQQILNLYGNKKGLDRVYPNFISTFPAYMNTRITPTTLTPALAKDYWIRHMFPHRGDTACPLLTLGESNPVARFELELEPIAASCVMIDTRFGYPTDVQVSVSGQSEAAVEALALGAEDGGIVVQPTLIARNGKWQATWILNMDQYTSEPGLMIISNVANSPADTQALKGRIEVAPTKWDSSMTYGPVPPPSPSPEKPEGGDLITVPTQTKRVKEKIDVGLGALNPNMAHGNDIARMPYIEPCEDAFLTKACGPYTSIHLSMVPGMYGSPMQATGRGGIFGQFSSMMTGTGSVDPATQASKIRQLVELADSIDGTDISIVIPLIDYGFTGAFTNASLTVSRKGGGRYRSLGTSDIEPGPDRKYPLAGKVKITEYTPTLIRGFFSGTLTDMDRVTLVGDDPVLPVHQNIEGSFQIIAAWLGDQRIQVKASEGAKESVMKDMAALSPGLNEDLNAALDDFDTSSDFRPRSTTRRPGAGSASYVEPDCDCSCNVADEPIERCLPQCGATYAACKGTTMASLFPSPSSSPSSTPTSDSGSFLRTLPNACRILDEATVKSLLVTDQLKPSGPRDWIPTVTSQCGYRDIDKVGKVTLQMLFTPRTLVDSATTPLDTLRLKAYGFNALTGGRFFDVQGVGKVGFGSVNEGNSTLKIYTGIYGVATGSDELVSELVITYSLSDKSQEDHVNFKKIYELAKVQVDRLEQLANESHEGSDW